MKQAVLFLTPYEFQSGDLVELNAGKPPFVIDRVGLMKGKRNGEHVPQLPAFDISLPENRPFGFRCFPPPETVFRVWRSVQ